MVLKTYMRIFTEDVEQSLPLLVALTGKQPDLRFSMPQQGLEIIAVGDFCLVAGAPVRSLTRSALCRVRWLWMIWMP